jgi:RNA polymerase sigma-70 factor (ECF subfamily)
MLAELESEACADETPSAELEAERRRRAIRELLVELPEEQAETLALRVMLGWSLEEVASATGAPVNTVRSRVRLAKEALRRRIEANPALADLRGPR